MDKQLLEILVCPVCKNELTFDQENNELICQKDQLAYPIRDQIPVMLPDQARKLEG